MPSRSPCGVSNVMRYGCFFGDGSWMILHPCFVSASIMNRSSGSLSFSCTPYVRNVSLT